MSACAAGEMVTQMRRDDSGCMARHGVAHDAAHHGGNGATGAHRSRAAGEQGREHWSRDTREIQ